MTAYIHTYIVHLHIIPSVPSTVLLCVNHSRMRGDMLGGPRDDNHALLYHPLQSTSPS